MKHALATTFALFALTTTGALAEDEAGRNEFMIACAGCHGETAKGDGPLAGLLNIDTPDLTTIAAEKGDGECPFT